MAVSRARNVERSRQAWLSYPLPTAHVAWLSNDVPACRGLAVAWLIRGARAPGGSLELGVPATVVTPGQGHEGGCSHGGGDDRDRPAQSLAHRGGDRPGGGAAGPVAGTGLRCSGGAAAGVGAGLAAAHRGGRRRGRSGPSPAARQLLAAGERVLDVPPKLAARVLLLATG